MKIHEPPMQFAEGKAEDWAKGLANNQDPYGNACYRFASEWATRMEATNPDSLTDSEFRVMMDRTSREADDEGITGFMFGVAVSMLAACWMHGERLRRIHNLATQIRDEGEKANKTGGVLNPALLRIE